MIPEKEKVVSKDIDKTIREFKKQLKTLVIEKEYPYYHSLLETLLAVISNYDKTA